MYVERKIKLWACNTADACLTKSANCSVVLHLSEQKTMIRTASVENAMLLVLLTSHFLSDSPQHSLPVCTCWHEYVVFQNGNM
jgi:hypothetical protein